MGKNSAFFADTTLGHRAWDRMVNRTTSEWILDRYRHTSHMIVIRKAPRRLPSASSESEPEPEPLEALAQRHDLERSKSEHKYADLYAMLFEPIRQQVRSFVQVGLPTDRVWREYFPGVFIHRLELLDLLHGDHRATARLHPESVDVVIDGESSFAFSARER